MLLSFQIKNCFSYKDGNHFSLLATREKQHSEHLSFLPRQKLKVLPTAALFGGNAAGKTNFFKALNSMRTFVLQGTVPDAKIPLTPYLLDKATRNAPCEFEIRFENQGRVFIYSYKADRHQVYEEELTECFATTEKVLFSRKGNLYEISDYLKKLSGSQGKETLNVISEGTRDNQLFLTNAVFQKQDCFRPVYNWFRDNLVLISPDSRFDGFEEFLSENSRLYPLMNQALEQLDTGLSGLQLDDYSFENIPMPPVMRDDIRKKLKEGVTWRIEDTFAGNRYIVTMEKGEIKAKKLMTKHLLADGSAEKFEMSQESDGTRRLIDLLPAFVDLFSGTCQKTYIVDELDRCLHPLLLRQLVQYFLGKCSNQNHGQLVFTTHNVILMKQDLLRRDEMWLTERDKNNYTRIFSFGEYKEIRFDKDILRSYLEGNLGGIPQLHLNLTLSKLHEGGQN